MNEIIISDKISYLEATENPLSADIGIIRDGDMLWLYDVGNGEQNFRIPEGKCNVVLSHFHQDHIGNLEKVIIDTLYVSKETYRHVQCGTIVREDRYLGNLHIFPLPSSHAKGCLGVEVDSTYAFVGDALYSKVKDNCYIYNAQLLKSEIDVLKRLQAPWLLVSHQSGLVRKREEAIAELEAIYKMRVKDEPEIKISNSFATKF